MTINKRRFVDYSILLLFIATSGFPYFSSPFFYILEFSILLYLFIFRRKKIELAAIVFFTILLIIFIAQTLIFNFFAPITVFGFFVRVLNAYLIIKILDIRFTEMYSKTLYYLSLISMIVYIPTALSPSMWPLFRSLIPLFNWINPLDTHESIMVYTLMHLESFRNSGPFWEPGAFAGYLTIAFIFSYISNPSLKSKQNIVLLLTILSTQSSTAFVALFIFLFFVNYVYIKNIFLKLLIILIIILSGYWAFFNLDFLGKKITSQLEMAQRSSIETNENTQRFLNVLRDIKDLEGHELVGRGVNPETRYSFGPKDQIRTVGISDIIVKFGIPFAILMLYMLIKSFDYYIRFHQHTQNRLLNAGVILTILVTLMSEVYFNFPMYWSLLFLIFAYKSPRRTS